MDTIVEPGLQIDLAATLAHKRHDDLIGYQEDGVSYVVHRDNLDKMAAMGLEHLPLSCIAVPEGSPLIRKENARLSKTDDYSRRLSEYFPVYFVAALYELQSLILRFGVKAYVIGGITRDLLLFHEKRLQVQDVDVTLEGNAIELADFLAENSRNFKVAERFPEFGTAKVNYKDSLMFDFASTRQEIYPHCGALPVVVKRGVPLVDDITRRDFSINALAFSIHELGHVLDYADGVRDIEAHTVRVLHPVSFFEDPSRILRAMKFCARFNFELADETRRLLEQFLRYGASHYKGGGERIKQELKGFLSVDESAAKHQRIHFFMETGATRLMNMESPYRPGMEITQQFACASKHLGYIQETLSQYIDRDFAFDTYLCFLCRDMPAEDFQKTSHRLGLTRNEREFVEQFRKLKDDLKAKLSSLHELSSPAEIYDFFHGLHFITVVATLVELGCEDEKRMKIVLEAFLKYKRKWEKLQLALDGNDLIELGVPEGKGVGILLNQLLHAKLVGQLPDRLDEIQYVQNHLQAQNKMKRSPKGEQPHAP